MTSGNRRGTDSSERQLVLIFSDGESPDITADPSHHGPAEAPVETINRQIKEELARELASLGFSREAITRLLNLEQPCHRRRQGIEE